MAEVMSVVPCGGDIAWSLLRSVSLEFLSYPGDYRTGRGAGTTPEEERLALCGRPLGGLARLKTPREIRGSHVQHAAAWFLLYITLYPRALFLSAALRC
jgi:hypothetical protein